MISTHLDTNGNGTGTKNAIGDYSGAAEDFYYQPPAGEVHDIERMIVCVEDTGGMQAQEYGNTGSALSTGISIIHEKAGVEQDLTDGVFVTSNAGWGRMCYDADVKDWGAGNDLLLVRWTFSRSGAPLRLWGVDADKVIARLNDDFTGLIAHYFLIQGQVVDPSTHV